MNVMVIEIPKGTSPEKIKGILKKRTSRRTKKTVNSFFGKLPKIEDGLTLQKKIRGEWK